jgi:hypothetical protein
MMRMMMKIEWKMKSTMELDLDLKWHVLRFERRNCREAAVCREGRWWMWRRLRIRMP